MVKICATYKLNNKHSTTKELHKKFEVLQYKKIVVWFYSKYLGLGTQSLEPTTLHL